MFAEKRIKEAYENASRIHFASDARLVLMSDTHRGDGSWCDDFANNQAVFFHALNYYDGKGFTYIELGDGDELWKNRRFTEIANQHSHIFWLLRQMYEANRFLMLHGNHDMVKRSPKWNLKNLNQVYNERLDRKTPLFPGIPAIEAAVITLEEPKGELFLLHGHQADFPNDKLWRINRFLVRHLWKPVELMGGRDPTRAAKNYKKMNKVEQKLTRFANKNGVLTIAGHTHRPVFPDPGKSLYFNDGSAVHPRCITAIEIDNGRICLIKWSVAPRSDGTLAVMREFLEEPKGLDEYFAAR
ncbi:MAG: metallophosphoesterase family protein [Oscillospiraceae bacterium]|nr:metallophosphoesterase family protein [Oscillospiraceae bacterium]